MTLQGKQISVIGAGIGGLAVARALALRGADVTVLEQAAKIAEIGAGLQISPNGFAVLRALGLAEALAADAVQGKAVSLRDYRKGEVLRLDLTRLDNHDYYFVHRADLIDVLAVGAREAGCKIRLLQKIDTVEPGRRSGDRPCITLASGACVEADLIVGADGLHSRVRQVLNGTSAPFFTGQTAWRAVIPNRSNRGPEVQVHMGPRRHVVSYPLRTGEFLNVVAVQERAAWAAESWSQEDDPANMRATFADFGPDVQSMLADVEKVHFWGLFRHPVAQTWHGGRTVLLGDAAHPTLPFLAQGASMALEDSWVLADALSETDDTDQALQAYQKRRAARVRRVVTAATGNARKYHLSFPPLRWAAHLVLKTGGTLAPVRMMQQFNWLYNHDVTRKL